MTYSVPKDKTNFLFSLSDGCRELLYPLRTPIFFDLFMMLLKTAFSALPLDNKLSFRLSKPTYT